MTSAINFWAEERARLSSARPLVLPRSNKRAFHKSWSLIVSWSNLAAHEGCKVSDKKRIETSTMIWIEQIRSLPGSCKIDSSVKAWFDVLCIETNIYIYIIIYIYISIYIISLSHIWVTLWNEMCSVHVWVGTKLLLANHPESSLPPLPSFWPRICVSICQLAIIQHARCYWPAQEIATPQKFLTLHAIPKPLLHDLLWTVEEKAALHIYLPHQAHDGFDGSEIRANQLR